MDISAELELGRKLWPTERAPIVPCRPGEAVHIEMTHDEYHREEQHDSSTTLRWFEKGPEDYYHRRITKRISEPATTDAKRLGSAKHAAILQPEQFPSLVKVIPAEVLSKSMSKAGKAWEEWRDANAGLLHIKQSEFDEIRWCIDSAYANKTVAALLKSATATEHSIFWTDQESRYLKCRLDMANEFSDVIADLKNIGCTIPEFWRSVKKLKSFAQAALYCDGYEMLNRRRPEFWYIVMEDESPFKCLARRLVPDDIDKGRELNRRTLADLYACKHGRKWITEGYDEPGDLYLPPWTFSGTDSPDPINDEVPHEF